MQPLGTRLALDDGRVFRYGKAGAVALAVGKLCQAALPITLGQHSNMTTAAAAAGVNVVNVTTVTTALTENQYAEGYMYVNDVDSEGSIYKVSGHPAQAAAGAINITLADPLWEALTANSQTSLLYNPYDNVLVAPATATAALVGDPVVLKTTAGAVAPAAAADNDLIPIVGRVAQVNATTEYAAIFLTLGA
jgi:hypothetical protein